jgi:mannose-6-phosphate isomerase-like protein (cupin superfamily)
MIAPLPDSALSLDRLTVDPGTSVSFAAEEADRLLYVVSGSGLLSVADDSAHVRVGSAALVLAEEAATLQATEALDALVARVGGEVDMHAPMGKRELVVSLDVADAQLATGSRSFQILFGPHNGSTRATLFAGYIPPGKAPWHYHLYDEIVWVPEGPGRLHVGDGAEELGPGAAFRLRPRQVHIVENLGDGDMTIIGVFTPAGSPSAAYLEPGVAAEYRIAG